MSNKYRTIKLSLAHGHNRINCIRLVRMMTDLHLWGAKALVDKLEEGGEVEILARKAKLNLAISEGLVEHGLLWKGVDK